MLPQHGGTPNFRPRLSTPVVVTLSLVLVAGLLLTLSLSWNTDAGDLAARQLSRLCAIVTLLLAILILIVGTERWWHTYLWKQNRNPRRHHHRRHESSSRHHSR